MRPTRLLGPAAVLLLVLGCCAPPGQRLLDATIEVEGRPALTALFSVSDALPAEKAWRHVQPQAWEVVDAAVAKPDAEDPARMVLTGSVRVTLMHVDSEFASATLGRLELRPHPDAAGQWRLAGGSAERLATSIR